MLAGSTPVSGASCMSWCFRLVTVGACDSTSDSKSRSVHTMDPPHCSLMLSRFIFIHVTSFIINLKKNYQIKKV